MANNIIIGANAVVAKTGITASFASAGVTSSNIAMIYEVGNPNKSYMPGRSINAITAFASEKGYYIIALQAMDLSAYVVPPIADTSNIPLTFGTVTGITNTGADWIAAGASGYANNHALADQKLPASTDGSIMADYISNLNEDAILGFNLTADNVSYNGINGGIEYFVYANGSGYTTGYNGANVATSSVVPLAGDKYRIIRAGSTLKAQYYRGSTWTDILTYPTTSTAELFINTAINTPDNKLSNPIGVGVIGR